MTKTILIVDDMAICREPIAEMLRARGFVALCAASGKDALTSLRAQHTDAVLLDMSMPDMDGLAVLRAIRANPQWLKLPVIMLTDRAEKGAVVEAARHGVTRYLLKSKFSVEILVTQLEAVLQPSATGATEKKHAPASPAHGTTAPVNTPSRSDSPYVKGSEGVPLNELTPLLTSAECTRLVTKGLDVRPLGATVQNVIAATSSAESSAEHVAKSVSQDQSLAIRVLKLANSSAYTRGRPVESVKDAVQRVGIGEVRSMVMALGVLDHYDQGTHQQLDLRSFWEHSTACGLIAAGLAKALRFKKPDEFFLWGTLHDIGRLILMENVSDIYAQVLEAAGNLGLPLDQVESKIMTLDHCDILKHALKHWKFPSEFIIPIVNHHQTLQTMMHLGPQQGKEAAVIALADRMAHSILLGSSGNDFLYLWEDLAEYLAVSSSTLFEIAKQAVSETSDLKFCMLARGNQTPWPDFAEQLRQRLGVCIEPLFVGVGAKLDSVRIMLNHLHPAGNGPANLAVAFVDKAHAVSQVVEALEAEERKLGIEPLPIAFIADRHNHLELASLPQRPCILLRMPMGITPFLEEISALVKKSSLTLEPALQG